jgi:hypothetical protein
VTEDEKKQFWQCYETLCLMMTHFYPSMTSDQQALYRVTCREMYSLCQYPGSFARHPGEWPELEPGEGYAAPSLINCLK